MSLKQNSTPHRQTWIILIIPNNLTKKQGFCYVRRVCDKCILPVSPKWVDAQNCHVRLLRSIIAQVQVHHLLYNDVFCLNSLQLVSIIMIRDLSKKCASWRQQQEYHIAESLNKTNHDHISEKPRNIDSQCHISNYSLDDFPFTLHIPFHIDVFQKLTVVSKERVLLMTCWVTQNLFS